MDVEAVATAIAAAARTVTISPRLNTLAYVPDSVPEPCGFVAELDIDYDRAHARGLDEITLVFRVLVNRGDDRASQRYLNQLLRGAGPTSLKAALEAARGAPGQPALGGAADDLHVRRASAHRWYVHTDATYLGIEYQIRVIGPGT